MKRTAADRYESVHSLPLPETSPQANSSLVRAQNGHIFCTICGFKNIYEVGLSTDRKKLELIKTHPIDEKIYKMTAATVGNIDYLFTSSIDSAVRLYRVDGSSFTQINKFQCTNPFCLLWLKERSILLVSEFNGTLNSDSVRAFKFDADLKKTVEDATVLNAKEGLVIRSWSETGENGVTLFDNKKKELVDMKVI